jgi:hypothetical protein
MEPTTPPTPPALPDLPQLLEHIARCLEIEGAAVLVVRATGWRHRVRILTRQEAPVEVILLAPGASYRGYATLRVELHQAFGPGPEPRL